MIDTTNQMLFRLDRANIELEKLTNQIASGQEISKGSEDSRLFAKELNIKSCLHTYENIKKHVDNTITQNNIVDKIMSEIKDAIQDFKLELQRASNSTTTDTDRSGIVIKLKSLRTQIIDAANSNIDSEFVFKGSNTTGATPPFDFDEATGAITYNGDNGLREVAIGKNIYYPKGINGNDLFAKGMTGTDKDATATGWYLDDLTSAITAVESNDLSDIADNIGKMSEFYDNVGGAFTKLGLRSDSFLKAQSRVETRITHYTFLEQEVSGADVAKASMQLQSLNMMYTAMYSTISKMNEMSLINFVR